MAYSQVEKDRILERVQVIGLRPAAREAGVSPSTVRGWMSSSPEVAASRASMHQKMIEQANALLDQMGTEVEEWVGVGGDGQPVRVTRSRPAPRDQSALASAVAALATALNRDLGPVVSGNCPDDGFIQFKMLGDYEAEILDVARQLNAGKDVFSLRVDRDLRPDGR